MSYIENFEEKKKFFREEKNFKKICQECFGKKFSSLIFYTYGVCPNCNKYAELGIL